MTFDLDKLVTEVSHVLDLVEQKVDKIPDPEWPVLATACVLCWHQRDRA
jgi:hypothetical protein